MSSNTTETLIGLLRVRDETGLAKYGTTLDRTDLTIEDWLHHGLEEALDLAGYLQCAKRQIGVLRGELACRDAEIARLAGENLRLRSVLLPFVELAKTISLEAPESSQVPSPVVCAFSTLTDTVENVELPVEKPVLNILNETNGQIIQEPTLTESILTEIIGENFTQVLPPTPTPPTKATRSYTAHELAAALGCHKDSIHNYRKAGLIGEPVPGTGGHPHNPNRFEVPSIPALRKAIAERQEAAKKAPAKSKAALTAAPPDPTFDINEEGKYQAIEQGKQTFLSAALFNLLRRTTDTGYLWSVKADGLSAPLGWDIFEEWRRTGLGKWESTPAEPGHVGTSNGVSLGARGYKVAVLG